MPTDPRKLRSQRLRSVNYQGDALRLGMNWTEEDLDKPQVLVDSAYGMGHPGTFHFRPLIEEVSNGVFEVGGKPAVFTVSDICDGVAQAHEGMSYSLVSRDIMAAMIEIHALGHPHDGMVLISGNDKSVPAHLLAIARCNMPAIHLPGGTQLNAPDYVTSDQLLPAGDAGCWSPSPPPRPPPTACARRCRRSPAKRRWSCWPTPRSATDSARRGCRRSPSTRACRSSSWWRCCARRSRLAPNLRNSRTMHGAREAGVEITIDDFDRIHRQVPVLANVKTTGRYPVEYFWYAGGVPAIMLELRDMLHLDCLTVTGKTVGENLEEIEHSRFFAERISYLNNVKASRREIIRPRSEPFGPDGGISVLRGNLAPGGAVIKAFSVPKEMHTHVGPARVFDYEEAVLDALRDRQVTPGDVVVIRYEGPRANGMPEMYFASTIIAADPALNTTTAIVTDGRFSGAMKGPCIGHITPEALDGGPIALVEENDLIEIHVPERRLAIVGVQGQRLPEDQVNRVLAERRARWTPPPPRHSSGILSLYARVARGSSEGASMT